MKLKKIYCLSVKKLVTTLVYLFFYGITFSQTAEFNFLHDTICVGDTVAIENLSTGASKYSWKLESGTFSDSISISLHDDLYPYHIRHYSYLDIIKVNSQYYGFIIADVRMGSELPNTNVLIRYSFGDNPINIPNRDTIIDIPQIFSSSDGGSYSSHEPYTKEIIEDENGNFFLFVVVESGLIARFSFGNDITNNPVMDRLEFGEYLSIPTSFKLINTNGSWHCIIGNEDGYLFQDEYKNIVLTTLKFNDGLGGDESTIYAKRYSSQELGLNYSLRIIDLVMANEDGKDFAFAMAYHSEIQTFSPNNTHLLRIEFNEDLTNAHTFDIHDFDNYFTRVMSFNLFKDCGTYFGMAGGQGSDYNDFTLLFSFENGLIEQVNIKDTLNFEFNTNQYFRYEEKLFFFITEGDKIGLSVINPFWNNVGGNPDPLSFEPVYYYTTPGTYNVVLTLNDDFDNSYCQIIDVIERPVKPDILPDDVCSGDSLFLSEYLYSNINYQWLYEGNNFSDEKFPKISNAGEYSVRIYYDGCYSNLDLKNISILPSPEPNIIPDTSYGCPWHDLGLSSLITGGALPYTNTFWSGEASIFLDSINSLAPTFNGHLGEYEKTIFLTDLEWEHVLPIDKKVSKNITIEGLPISLINQDLSNGLSTSSNVNIKYRIPVGYTNFKASVGIDGSIINCGTVIFNVYVDTGLIYSSGIMQHQQRKDIDIDISGSQYIELELTDANDGTFCDISNWANARFVMLPPIYQYELELSTTDSIGCQGFDTALVILDTNIIHILTKPENLEVCPNDSALIALEIFYPLVASNATCQLQKDSVGIWQSIELKNAVPGFNNISFLIPEVIPNDTGNYRIVLASDPCGVDTTNPFTIKYFPSPTIISAPDNFVCNPDTVILTIQTSFGYNEWYDTIVGGNVIDTGNVYISPYLDSSKTYFYRPFDSICQLKERFPINALVYHSPNIDSIDAIWTTHCDSTNGKIEIFLSGGSSPIYYSIDSGYTYQDSNLFNNLNMSYYFTFLSYGDSNCIASLDSTVLVSNVIAPQISNMGKTDISDCGLSDGYITHTGIYGVQPYEFRVNNQAWINNSTISGLGEGLYYSWIRNSDGSCELMHPYPNIIRAPVEPVLNYEPGTIDNSDCNINEGVIISDASGELPVLYSIDSLSWQFSGVFDSLYSGTYNLYLKYFPNLCVVKTTENITIIEPEAPIIDTIIKNNIISCFNPNAYIEIYGSEGQGLYVYSIDSGKTWSYNSKYSDLVENTYFIAIGNSNGTCKVFNTSSTEIIKACKDEILDTFCKSDSLYHLSELLPPLLSDTGLWIDINSTGALEDNKIRVEKIPEGANIFNYIIDSSIIQVTITAYNEKASGQSVFREYCTDSVNLFNSLVDETYDKDGNWYNLQTNSIEYDSIIMDYTGTLFFIYQVEAEPWSPCPTVETKINLYIDSVAPDIDCSDIDYFSDVIPAGQNLYKISTELFPMIKESKCGINFTLNDLNYSNTLLNEEIQSGLYEITWYAGDYADNTSQCSIVIEIIEFEIPSLFTPNGDGYNDNWVVNVQENYPNAEIYLYDRWGNLVIASKDGYINWDGKINNKVVPVDGYQYIILDNEKTILSGSVTIWY